VKSAPRFVQLSPDDRTWRVIWFGAVRSNPRAPSEPVIDVMIAPLRDSSAYAETPDARRAENAMADGVRYERHPWIDGERRVVRLGVGSLPAVILGSLWRKGRCVALPAYRSLAATIDDNESPPWLAPEAGDVRSPAHARASIPASEYPITRPVETRGDVYSSRSAHAAPSGAERNGIGANCVRIAFRAGETHGTLVIPCSEVIRFYYAPATQLARRMYSGALLATRGRAQEVPQPVREAAHADDIRYATHHLGVPHFGALYDPATSQWTDEGRRQAHIRLRRGMDEDAVAVAARLRYDAVARLRAARIAGPPRTEVVSGEVEPRPGFFPAALPPLLGCSLLRVHGETIRRTEHTWDVLVLYIVECTARFPFEQLTYSLAGGGHAAPAHSPGGGAGVEAGRSPIETTRHHRRTTGSRPRADTGTVTIEAEPDNRRAAVRAVALEPRYSGLEGRITPVATPSRIQGSDAREVSPGRPAHGRGMATGAGRSGGTGGAPLRLGAGAGALTAAVAAATTAGDMPEELARFARIMTRVPGHLTAAEVVPVHVDCGTGEVALKPALSELNAIPGSSDASARWVGPIVSGGQWVARRRASLYRVTEASGVAYVLELERAGRAFFTLVIADLRFVDDPDAHARRIPNDILALAVRRRGSWSRWHDAVGDFARGRVRHQHPSSRESEEDMARRIAACIRRVLRSGGCHTLPPQPPP